MFKPIRNFDQETTSEGIFQVQLINKKFQLGIRARLFVAFGTLSVLTLIASSVGWISNSQLGHELEAVVEKNVFAAGLISNLREYGATITSTAPTLMLVEDNESREQIYQNIKVSLSAMDGLISDLSDLTDASPMLPTLAEQITAVRKYTFNLNDKIIRRLSVKADKLNENQRLRWASESFLGDINKLIVDVSQSLESRNLQDLSTSIWSSSNEPLFKAKAINSPLAILYRTKADVNLLVSLVDRAQHLPDISSLIAARIYSEEVTQRIKNDLALIDSLHGASVLKKNVNNIFLLTRGNNNMFTIRTEERALIESEKTLLENIQNHLQLFNTSVAEQVNKTEYDATQSSLSAQATIKRGQIWLLLMVSISFLLSIIIVWLYVSRNIVARITHLDSCMKAIASGDMNKKVPVDGRDEIATMASSLLSFRDQLLDLQEELVQTGRLAALGQLSAGIAHEINQPLSAINHYAHNGLRLMKLGQLESTEQNLVQISSLTQRATTIITRLKSMARKPIDNLEKVNLNELIHRVLTMFVGDEVYKTTQIKLAMDKNSLWIWADAIQLEQVIVNLFTNALDAIKDSDVKCIRIQTLPEQKNIGIYISDTGAGIDEELRSHIFEPFFTTKRIGQNLGLGLSISYNIIESMGGKLRVDMQRSSGACFSIHLPKYQDI